MDNYIKIGLALLFLGCLADMPYGYFQLVRFLGMLGFAVLALQSENPTWRTFLWCSAILINPFFKITLGRELWNIIDVLWAIILLVSLDYKEDQR